ncbi:MAG TPA: dihydrofolate reductase [Cytophagaceae bacterium]|jgi:dihydrofolate reductase
MLISLIVAISKNKAIGKDNNLPWHLPLDLKHFKNLTMGHCIVMGRKTFESIGKPLPGRTNIIITNNKDYQAPGCIVKHSLSEGLREAELQGEQEAFIIGGSSLFKETLEKASKIYLTKVHAEVDGDTFFKFDQKDWKETSSESHDVDSTHKFPFTFYTLERTTGKMGA